MRVVVVSAHYPPDFVSGGTLVPQREARGLQARGHEVNVFAGSLDRTRPALDEWDDRDETGVPVHWVSTHPWTARADRLTYDNPDVAAAFARWLRPLDPDIVHLHSLQSMGAGLIEVAAATKARVVVTAHDFWWHCARQFLVDRSMTPCSLVVAAGSCACEVDQSWLDARNRQIGAALGAADLVLAPSTSAARVLAANGVDLARLRVDENGLPAMSFPAGAPRSDVGAATVRLLFTGGGDPMKGWPVLREAAGRLAALPGWTLSAYGVPGGARLPAQVTARPPYPPADLPDVLASHDVLVLPSLMRESHSLVTREALLAGLAVVCSDVLGPEEVVVHDVNGLVVPAGDAASLAAAMEALTTDPAELGRLRAPSKVSIRSIDDQVLGLEGLFATLLAAPEPEVAQPLPADPGHEGPVPQPLPVDVIPQLRATATGALAPPLHRVLFIAGIDGAPLRYRVHLPAESLRALGHSVEVRWYRDPALPDLCRSADAVVIYRVPATAQIVDLVATLRRERPAVPVLFDVDDLIFDPELRGEVHGLAGLSDTEADLWWRGVSRYRTTMELADVYVGSTEGLCDHAARVTGMPTRRFANGVGMLLGQLSDRALRLPRTPGALRIGYFSGTTTHDADWAQIEPAVIDVMVADPSLELWLGGHLRPTPALGVVADRVRRWPMQAWTDLPGRLRDLDVNLAPLVPGSRFNEAKSAIKWSEAALVGTVTIASPTQPFREIVEDGVSGVLAAGADEWRDNLHRLVRDPALRARLGGRARREALLRLSPHVQGRVYQDILLTAMTQVAAHGPRAMTSGWEPVTDDEPFTRSRLEPYELPAQPDLPVEQPGEASRLRRLAGQTVRLYREEGAVETVRRATAKVGRRLRAR